MADKEKKKKKPEAGEEVKTDETVNEAAAQTAEKPKETEEKKETENNETPNPADEIEALSKKAAELNDALLRTAAEYDNFRKRSQKEKEAIYADSKSEIVAKFLPVLDNFERAALAGSDFESYKKGIEMTVKQLLDVFTNVGVESFGEKGEAFDPNIHNGVMHIEDETLGENEIAEVFMKGYKLGDKVIRHATVKVAN